MLIYDSESQCSTKPRSKLQSREPHCPIYITQTHLKGFGEAVARLFGENRPAMQETAAAESRRREWLNKAR